jgi:hypothetical protein
LANTVHDLRKLDFSEHGSGPKYGLGPAYAQMSADMMGADAYWSLLKLHWTVEDASCALAPLAPELAALHDRGVEFWGITGATAGEVARGLAVRVLREARSAAGLGGEKLLLRHDAPVLKAKAEAITRQLAALRLPDTKPLATQVTQEVGQAARARWEVSYRARAEADGPGGLVEPKTLRWGGGLYRFSRRQWLLLQCLWGGKPTPEEDVLQHVYGYDDEEAALKQLAHRLNNELAKYELPFRVHRSAAYWELRRLEP